MNRVLLWYKIQFVQIIQQKMYRRREVSFLTFDEALDLGIGDAIVDQSWGQKEASKGWSSNETTWWTIDFSSESSKAVDSNSIQ